MRQAARTIGQAGWVDRWAATGGRSDNDHGQATAGVRQELHEFACVAGSDEERHLEALAVSLHVPVAQ